MTRLAWVVLLLWGCGDDDGVVRFPPRDSGVDAGRDAGPIPDGGVDTGTPDSGPPGTRDAGPAPDCEQATIVSTLLPEFTGEREGDPDSFAMISGVGPAAFGYRTQTGTGPLRLVQARVASIALDGSELGNAMVDEVTGEMVRLADVSVAPNGSGDIHVAWAQEDADDMGMIVAARLRHARVARDGTEVRAPATFREMSTSPFLAWTVESSEGPWLLRSDFVMVGGTTGVIPRLVQLDPDGAPLGSERDLMAFLRPEAREVILELAPAGPFVAYRVGTSTAVVLPLDDTGSPRGGERRHEGVPRLDDAAGADDAIALVGISAAGGMATVEVLVLDDLGTLRHRHVLAMDVAGGADVRAAVVAAWPGFVVLWREGSGADAILRGAGLTTDGTLLVPPEDVAEIPGSTGSLFADAGGVIIGAGARARNAVGDHLQLAVFCPPQ